MTRTRFRLSLALAFLVTVPFITGCATRDALAPTDPRCVPPEAPATRIDALPGGIIAGDWTITHWDPPPGRHERR
jgi:hypothetical protein